MDLNVKGKVALITGGGEGVGRLVGLMLAEEGANTVLGDVDLSKAENVADEVRALGSKALAFNVDITNQDQVNQMAQKAIDEFKRIDILVNVPGRGERTTFSASSREDWDFSINLNLYGMLNCTKAVIDQMMEQKYGKIVSVVSDAGRVGENMNPVYSAAKGGVIAITKSLAKELGRYKVNVNCVSLSAMNTPAGLRWRGEISEGMGEETWKVYEKKILSNYPIRRFGEVEDAANAICFLVSDRASWITGQTLSVNGGYCMI